MTRDEITNVRVSRLTHAQIVAQAAIHGTGITRIVEAAIAVWSKQPQMARFASLARQKAEPRTRKKSTRAAAVTEAAKPT